MASGTSTVQPCDEVRRPGSTFVSASRPWLLRDLGRAYRDSRRGATGTSWALDISWKGKVSVGAQPHVREPPTRVVRPQPGRARRPNACYAVREGIRLVPPSRVCYMHVTAMLASPTRTASVRAGAFEGPRPS